MTEELLKHVFMSYIFLEEPDLLEETKTMRISKRNQKMQIFQLQRSKCTAKFLV